MKIKVGILFGGTSREREISFAGGRTVYDNLNKNLFDPVPVFVDSFGNFIKLNWEFIYKGSIRDFYPAVDLLPESPNEFQVYAESLDLSEEQHKQLISSLGEKIEPSDFKKIFDFAFLCLHGPYGEDGRIQGLLEYYGMPYSGAGILSSSIGINKSIQKKLMVSAGFPSPQFHSLKRSEWISAKPDLAGIISKLGFPLVVKPANQGSSVGVSIIHEAALVSAAIDKAFFIHKITSDFWNSLDTNAQVDYVRTLSDIREGLGMPVILNNEKIIRHPEELLVTISQVLKSEKMLTLEATDSESEVLLEEFIEGKEFSCIVVQNTDGTPVALPPTEIRKGKELFDYRSKYLPGLSRKITPIDIDSSLLQKIRYNCERLYTALEFDVYARIDGFLSTKGEIFLNDPNTTSGMMPSSFFFHQAAEIGLNPSQFLTYIIHTSLSCRVADFKGSGNTVSIIKRLDVLMEGEKAADNRKKNVAVILGGYSSERHISVESGRNIYEKLASSGKFEPVPVFLTGSNEEHKLYMIPVNVLLKDNADDIKEKVDHFNVHPLISLIMHETKGITEKYSSPDALKAPAQITYSDLASMADLVFIALHGRPGEDGAVQQQLEKYGIPYNGSGIQSSKTTIDKYVTNEILMQHGFLAAKHLLVSEDDWKKSSSQVYSDLKSKLGVPFIAKPVDDGCSSAVRKIKSEKELLAFGDLIFRQQEDLEPTAAATLNIKPKEEFPRKKVFLAEELISKKDAVHFLEITGGMVTSIGKDGQVKYEVFEASEALSEGEVLSLEEKFLAGQGQNITPARYAADPAERQRISEIVKKTLEGAAKVLNVVGYTRIDAFVRVYADGKVDVVFVEVNSLPGMTPATCIFHQASINHYKPHEFIEKILSFAETKRNFSAMTV